MYTEPTHKSVKYNNNNTAVVGIVLPPNYIPNNIIISIKLSLLSRVTHT